MKLITSPHNATIRKIEQLQRKSRARRSEGIFVIEGRREIMLADQGYYELDTLFVCDDLFQDTDTTDPQNIYHKLNIKQSPQVIKVSREVYENIAYRGGVEGCLAFAKAKNFKLQDLQLSEKPLILIAESPEKPGNLGALLRTADAAKVDAMIVVAPTTDLYNPNVIRSSVGCLFTVPTVTVETAAELTDFLQTKKIDLFAATLQNSTRYDQQDFTNGCAIAVGTEATGLDQALRDAAKANVIIPMGGAIDSMNVSVSAAILLFEAKRQRNFK
ncbi:rRNA methyltransferase [Nonlabens spongiae]|uniref:rRNA methyltransferase n=1 Tax=Nonlabens spongiae TaxID=331648 RepID=A0A1W6MP76_9FLAO|nr:TrmH family RNA methyltransferase [Nonlabens spongiae]ARN79306.1 rRNA methyltransferase [Nonlabens spongiae]